MNFEHLIQINDLQNPLVETLTRDQVWRGLQHRIEDATPFLPGLERCTIVARHADADELATLKLSAGAIVLETIAVNADPDGVPVQYSRSRFAADRVTLRMET